MVKISLPPRSGKGAPGRFPRAGQVTIVGASGAGKTRFMRRLIADAGERAFVLSPLCTLRGMGAGSSMQGLFDARFSGGATALPPEATDLDRLCRVLLADEFAYLLSVKKERFSGNSSARFEPTKLDTLAASWQSIFPGNELLRESDELKFATTSGTDLVTTLKLSAGERAVLYYIGMALYAPQDAMVFVDEPTMLLHPSLLQPLWNEVEGLRPDCTFVYNTSDPEFLSSRTSNACIWVRSHDAAAQTWDYTVMEPGTLPDELLLSLMGQRRGVIFIEGDATHSIDAKLYPLVFPGSSVRPLGSCTRVIESTRAFGELRGLHKLESRGIVDRDRRTQAEVDYLRSKRIMVPEVAEIENIFLLEGVIRIMARMRSKDPDRVVERVRRSVVRMFSQHMERQALQHVRHRMKREMACRADARVESVEALALHLQELVEGLDLKAQYDELLSEFATMVRESDYSGILRVFNHKPMLSECGVVQLLGFGGRQEYVSAVLSALKGTGARTRQLRRVIRKCFGEQ